MAYKLACIVLALCAAASAKPENRIVGGLPTYVYDAPYVVAITYHYPGIGISLQRCVGALISSYHVLTTGFCFTGANLNNMQVRAGSTYSMYGGITVPVSRFVKYPYYLEAPRTGDIAVLFVAEPIPIVGPISTLYLPAPNSYIPLQTPIKVTGWGFESEAPGSLQLDFLTSVELYKWSHEACEYAYQNSNAYIDYTVFCASAPGRGTCHGDSGAPAVIDDVIVGLASYYQDCDSDYYPDVFTRIDFYSYWILEVASGEVKTKALN